MSESLSRQDFASRYGPWALIAGASDGTGEEFANQLAAKGLNCILVARREDVLNAVAKNLQDRYGVKTRIIVQDLSVAEAPQNILEKTADLEIGLFVANAGAASGGHFFADAPLEDWQRLMNLNINIPVTICHRLLPSLVKRGCGGLLLMNSGIALGGQPMTAIYGGSKAFGLNFAEALWAEYKNQGIDVLSVVAPLIDTPKLRSGFGNGSIPDNIPHIFPSREVVRIAIEQLPIGPCYVFPAGPEEHNAEQVTEARRQRVFQVIEIAKAIFAKS